MGRGCRKGGGGGADGGFGFGGGLCSNAGMLHISNNRIFHIYNPIQPHIQPHQYNHQYMPCVWLVTPDSIIGGQVPVEIRNLCSICGRSAGHIQRQLLLLQACLPSPSLLLLPLLLLLSLMVDAPP